MSRRTPVFRVEERRKTWDERNQNWGGGRSGKTVTLYCLFFFPSYYLVNSPHKVGGNCDSRELVKVGTSQ